MISVTEAFAILENFNYSRRIVELPLLNTRNHVLAERIFSPISMPPFRQATMDGYALCLHPESHYEIVGEIKAGDVFDKTLQPGQAVKIFTGAAVPHSAQAVIQIEKVRVEATALILQENIKPETNIRQKGAQISEQDLALEEGTLLQTAAIGFLAGLGRHTVKVYQKPSVAVVVTGNELVEIGNPLPEGKVYNSNTIMLQTALLNAGYEHTKTYKVKDDFQSTQVVLEQALAENDVVLVSGGISVGDYDFVGKALESLKVETLFYKVNQKPGKPLLAGVKEQKLIFALPGNPAASLTCFYIYVRPALYRYSGIDTRFGSALQLKMAHDFSVDNSRAQFLKALVSDEKVTILPHQDSAMLDSFVTANALAFLPEGQYEVYQNDAVNIYLL
ncbi:molybdopterin molybdenumtransferase MoeA [Flavobacterium silvisoli]|uniref:Molybdopterin molybdenumtransferase n=1 Tax=Flavobacterium silvisoli TaxID=2529433 RepID=A0A4Q9YQ16_9FLAO|nr:gephyrin-like molybdotransferase Glp [Flavobacterium silvisoli]TBX65573.1 molybdopterin molybdenumtransferase MoeA [Flavobacterium silvisoli]